MKMKDSMSKSEMKAMMKREMEAMMKKMMMDMSSGMHTPSKMKAEKQSKITEAAGHKY